MRTRTSDRRVRAEDSHECPYYIRVTYPVGADPYTPEDTRLAETQYDYTMERAPLEHPGPYLYLRWGSVKANSWFTSGSGVSWKAAAQKCQKTSPRNITSQ